MNFNYVRFYKAIYTDIITHCNFVKDASIRAHDAIEYLLKDELIIQNGYDICYNPHFKEWQTSHPAIGQTEGFKALYDAVVYCEKG